MSRKDGIIRILPGERFTPFTLANKLNAKVILESSSFENGRERYSLLMLDEAFRVFQQNTSIFLKRDGETFELHSKGKDILDVLEYFAGQHASLKQDFPFPAGGLGFLSFEFSRFCDSIKIPDRDDELDLPDALFLFGHVFVVFDHYTDLIYLIGLNYREHEVDLKAAVDEVENKINDLNFNYLHPAETEYTAKVIRGDEEKDFYMGAVETLKEEIVKGNLLQAVPARRMVIETEMPALEAYRRLRSNNPSPYLFYIDFGDYQLFGSSPEVHVKVKNGKAEIRPIAGTRRRGATDAEDKALEADLLADPKEKAEHLMLVDLARNDFGRVCKTGTVNVDAFMTIERYSHVMHIVSTVTGELDEGKRGIHAIRATFPAGTVSGAPKIQAIETLAKIEKLPRRFYAGLVGYLEPDGDLDTCITIRSALKKGNTMYLQAGGGIVYDSTPEREYEETKEKLGALVRALGVEVE